MWDVVTIARTGTRLGISHATGHPVIEDYDPPEGWGWCYIDELMLDLSGHVTPHNGPIPRHY
jgi:hypothetical protein